MMDVDGDGDGDGWVDDDNGGADELAMLLTMRILRAESSPGKKLLPILTGPRHFLSIPFQLPINVVGNQGTPVMVGWLYWRWLRMVTALISW